MTRPGRASAWRRRPRPALALLVGLSLAACRPFDLGAGSDGPEPAPPPPPRPPRSSLEPVFALAPRAEYDRLAPPLAGVPAPLSDADFAAAAVGVSAADQLDAVAGRIARERGLAEAPDPIPDADDRLRARSIPFRGNPSDVLLVDRPDLPDGPRLFVPLGGDLMTPGFEVAVLDLEGGPALRARVPVGLRPTALALHPAGLVFVCNQYSNYLSILDARRGERLERGGSPVEIRSAFHCSDLAFAPREPAARDADAQHLYVSNRWRRSVLVYRVDVLRDSDGVVADVTQTNAAGDVDYEPLHEIRDVGPAPARLAVDPARRALYVANHRGGALVRIDLDLHAVTARFEAGAPSVDVVAVGERVYVPTLMPDRGLLAPEDAGVSPRVQAAPLEVTGLDDAVHVAHPGALTDETRSYNFEDVRNGLYELDAGLTAESALYYTDDVSAEPAFAAEQKILAGALPQAIARNAAGDRLYVAFGGSDRVQELALDPAAAFTLSPGRVFATRERPFALALDEEQARLYVAAWGGEVIEVFSLATGLRIAEVDLGYAEPRYPATGIEVGERGFYDAAWSNNGRKSCAHCHFDELVSDGVGFSNGATAPTATHRVKPNHDLLTTDAYFWNGSFANGSYRSLAFAAQTRTNCEIVLFGLVEGPASDPATRRGDPENVTADPEDAGCRPAPGGPGELPANFDAIAARVAAARLRADAHVLAATGLGADALSRAIDLYAAAELRLPPNPLHQALRQGLGTDLVGEAERERAAEGEFLFLAAGCAGCHEPRNPRHPFSNGAERGSGADWSARFADAYADDPRLGAALPGGLPAVFLDAIRTGLPSPDVNVHVDPIDFFTPFCFATGSCLAFEDPLDPAIDAAEETRRLELLLRFNLADPQRGFVPGNVRGQVAANVPSLRGSWTQANLLHHGLARSVREAILAPGHPALGPGERGYAVGPGGELDSHGATRALTPAQVEALVLYVRSLQ